MSTLKATANASLAGQSPTKCLQSLGIMITRMNGLKRKLEKLHEEEKVLHEHSRKRIQHLQQLYEIPSLVDVQYDQWSRVRLNRLLVDYMLRGGYAESARALAREVNIEELVDLDVFVKCHAIEESLRKGSTQECLTWCAEHKYMMKKAKVRRRQFAFQIILILFTCVDGVIFVRMGKLTYFLIINLEPP